MKVRKLIIVCINPCRTNGQSLHGEAWHAAEQDHRGPSSGATRGPKNDGGGQRCRIAQTQPAKTAKDIDAKSARPSDLMIDWLFGCDRVFAARQKDRKIWRHLT